MKRRLFLFLILVLSVSFFSVTASAQRLINGQVFATAYASCWSQYGVDVGAGLVQKAGKLFFKASYLTCPDEIYHIDETEEYYAADFAFQPQDMLFSGGYLVRILSNRSRSVNFYLGGTLDLGARFFTYRDEEVWGVPDCKFVIGLSPTVEFEVFLAKPFAMNLYYKPRVQFLANNIFYNEVGVGFTYYFFVK